MGRSKALLTPEEQARIIELKQLLIGRFVERNEAIEDGQEARVQELEVEIDALLSEKEEIEKKGIGRSA